MQQFMPEGTPNWRSQQARLTVRYGFTLATKYAEQEESQDL